MIRLNIQTKLFILLSGLTIAVLLIVLIFVSRNSTRKIEADILADFEQLQYFFKVQQALRYDRLLESAYLIVENNTFKERIEGGDTEEIYFSVLEFSQFTQTDIIVVTDFEGKVTSWLGDPTQIGRVITEFTGITEALEYYDPLVDLEWPDMWQIEEDVYQIATVPIFNFDDDIVGSLTLGSKMQSFEAEELAEGTPYEITFFNNQEIIGASGADFSFGDYATLIANKFDEIDTLLVNLEISEPFREVIRGEEHLAFISPLGKGEGNRLFYIASIPVAQEFATIAFIQNNILLTGMITIVLILPLTIFMGRFFSQPITTLSSAMVEVRDGDLEVYVEPTTKDEVGVLTESFNEMIVGLRERFALSRYVGSHTLEMIQENSKEAELGGSFQNLAIVFSDIRGSTAKISTTDPKHFVEILNKTLGFQSECFKKFGGAIDKFVGDEVIAVFSGADALKRAIEASIEIQNYFNDHDELNTFFRGLGIGVNYGSMVLGNMGAKDRMDYTIIGPEVNLCARLCSAAEDGEIFLTKKCILEQDLSEAFSYKEVKALQLKGFSEPIEVVSIIYD